MKTITITDEQYNALQEMQNLLNTQDNRCTANPIFVMMEIEKVPTAEDYQDGQEWYDADNCESYATIESVYESISEHLEYLNNPIKSFDEFKQALNDNFNDFDEAFGLNIYKVYYKNIETINHNVFSFFEQDVKDHENINGHNLRNKKHFDYACSLWRTPRMENLRNILMELNLSE